MARNRKQTPTTGNPWEDKALVDHVEILPQRLELYTELAYIVAHPEHDESIADAAAKALPGLLAEETQRAALIEQLVRAQQHPHLKVETA